MNLLFCIDRRALGQLAVCLRSIAKNGGAAHYRVFLLHSDLDALIRENLAREGICSNVFVTGNVTKVFTAVDSSVCY